MTFDSRERSLFAGEPIWLLRLTRGAVVARYAAGDRQVTVGDDLYAPLAWTRTEIGDSAEQNKNAVTITLPKSASVFSWWYPYPPSRRVKVELLVFHRGDAEVALEWTGRVGDRSRTDKDLVLRCTQSRVSNRNRGHVLCWMKGCPLVVYSTGNGMCNLDPEDFEVPATVGSLSGAVLVCAAFAASPLSLAGGWVEYTRPDGEPEERSVLTHVVGSDTVVLNYGTDAIAPGDDVSGFPGCAGDWEACEARENTDNYGGCPQLPNKNPYSGNPR